MSGELDQANSQENLESCRLLTYRDPVGVVFVCCECEAVGRDAVCCVVARSQKEREKIDLRGRVITTMDRELSALRTGRKLSDRQGNENLSVKNLIASIEHQVPPPLPFPALKIAV